MKKDFKLFGLLLVFAVVFVSTSCDDDDDDGVDLIEQNSDNVVVTQNIEENTTWIADNTYQLSGRITVMDGATLTIEAGTVIKGEMGTGANATALVVARGGKLMAEGTASMPIIFTSVGDEITSEDIAAGDFASPNLTSDANGLWGGVLILGKAPISASNEVGDITEVQIEGIPTSDPNGLYGGSVENDNSGVLKYVSIRHGGANIGSGNEINGLTLGGVGSATVIENVEIIANQDDGIEWFGGTVNVKNALVWNVGDDAIDADQSWVGSLDNFVVVAPGDHIFELDGPEGSANYGQYTLKNGVVVANDTRVEGQERYSSDLINTDDNTSVVMDNIFFTSIESTQLVNRVEHSEGQTSFNDIVFDVDGETLGSYFPEGIIPEGFSADNSPANSSAIDLSVFNWTWAYQDGVIPTL